MKSQSVLVEHTCSMGHKTKVKMVKVGKEFRYDNFCNNLCTHNCCDRVAQITDNRITNKKFSIHTILQFAIWLLISPFMALADKIEEIKWRE